MHGISIILINMLSNDIYKVCKLGRYISPDVQNPRSKLGRSSISLVHVCSFEAFFTLSIGPYEAQGVELDLPKGKSPSHL